MRASAGGGQAREARQRARARTQQQFAKEWGGEWGQYRDEEAVRGLGLEATLAALARVLQSQRQLLLHSNTSFAAAARALHAAQTIAASLPS